MKYLRKLLPLSASGFVSLRWGILADTFRDLCQFLPFIVIWKLMRVVLQPVTDGSAPDLKAIGQI